MNEARDHFPAPDAERTDQAYPLIRPKDAAAMILIDRSSPDWRVLLGRRSARHAFMPETYVFPGGRRDSDDYATPVLSDLHPDVLARLSTGNAARFRPATARALANAAVRELAEETGLVIGQAGLGRWNRPMVAGDLRHLRFLARAITPPGHVRRYDTRFFVAFTDEVGLNPAAICDSDELSDLGWHSPDATTRLPLPDITRIILAELVNVMNKEPALPFGMTVPFYFTRHGQFMRSYL